MSTQQQRYFSALLCLAVCLLWSGHLFFHAEAHHDEHHEHEEHDGEICLLCTLAKDVESIDPPDVESVLERSDAVVLPLVTVSMPATSSPETARFSRGPPPARRFSFPHD